MKRSRCGSPAKRFNVQKFSAGRCARLLAFALAIMLMASPVFAQQGQYQITRSVIAGGGGSSSGGNITVDGTIGQSIVGASSGAAYTVSGGVEPVTPGATPTPTPAPLITYVVTNTNDSGMGSLRQAISDANASSGFDAITFNIPVAGTQTIAPASPLPTIADPVFIDGFSQPGAQANSLAVGDDSNMLIEVSGFMPNAGQNGLVITAGNSIVRGLTIYGFSSAAIKLQTNGGNTIEGCFFGLYSFGTQMASTAGGPIRLESGNNLIGGTTPAARNAIIGGSGVPAIYSIVNTGGVIRFRGTTSARTRPARPH